MKVLVCGDRNWKNVKKIARRLRLLPERSMIITGGARGADSIAHEQAQRLGFETKVVLPEWHRYGKAAGPIRNRKMLQEEPELVLAFHSDLEKSHGTRDCILQARALSISVEVIT